MEGNTADTFPVVHTNDYSWSHDGKTELKLCGYSFGDYPKESHYIYKNCKYWGFLQRSCQPNKYEINMNPIELFSGDYSNCDEYDKIAAEEKRITEQLSKLFGADYTFYVNIKGSDYFVNMIDEDTHQCAQFMIQDKIIYTLMDEDAEESDTPELDAIFIEEKKSVINIINMNKQ